MKNHLENKISPYKELLADEEFCSLSPLIKREEDLHQ